MGARCIGLTESYRGGDSVNDSIDVDDDDDPSEDMGIAKQGERDGFSLLMATKPLSTLTYEYASIAVRSRFELHWQK